MRMLRAPGLGPLLGHTTHDSCRVWIRADDPVDKGAHLASERRTLGVIGLLSKRDKIKDAYYFRLPREFDRTGTFWLGRDVALGGHASDGVPKSKQGKPCVLKPDTEYTVRVGTITLDDPLPDAESIDDAALAAGLPDIDVVAQELLSFPDDCEATLRTFPDPRSTASELSFLIGSCRYPGLLWKIKEADRIFGPMCDHLAPPKSDSAARFTLMMGDQIYADMLNRMIPIGLADTYEEFQERYIKAFEAPNLRRLLRSAPTYMAIDDHEIEDNWTQDRLAEPGKHRLFNLAIGAYMSYQWSHGPRSWNRLLYYDFECAGYPFFVFDTRTQRLKDDQEGLRDNHLLGRPSLDPTHNPGQLRRFLDWLGRQQKERGDVPKFVVSASVFAPNPIDERIDPDFLPEKLRNAKGASNDSLLFEANRRRREKSDSWPAYPATRHAILEHIVKNNIQNVVFLTGDVHCANIAQLEFTGNPKARKLRAYDVTSSAFYWPFPFADGDPNGYVHDSKATGQIDTFPINGTGVDMNYRAWGFTQEDNFCRLTLDKRAHSLEVRVFDREGSPVKVTNEQGKPVEANSLPLADWD